MRTFPDAPILRPRAATVASSGASRIATTSYLPSVQYMSLTVTLAFLASARTASARLAVSLTLRIPWSVNFPSRMYVGMGVPPFGCHRTTNPPPPQLRGVPHPPPGPGPVALRPLTLGGIRRHAPHPRPPVGPRRPGGGRRPGEARRGPRRGREVEPRQPPQRRQPVRRRPEPGREPDRR